MVIVLDVIDMNGDRWLINPEHVTHIFRKKEDWFKPVNLLEERKLIIWVAGGGAGIKFTGVTALELWNYFSSQALPLPQPRT